MDGKIIRDFMEDWNSKSDFPKTPLINFSFPEKFYCETGRIRYPNIKGKKTFS